MKIKKNTFSTLVLELFFPSIANCGESKNHMIMQKSLHPQNKFGNYKYNAERDSLTRFLTPQFILPTNPALVLDYHPNLVSIWM
jgi:hypothetical protein